MPLVDQVPQILKYVENYAPTISHNKNLFDIYEGDLLKFIEQDMRAQLSPQFYNLARYRIAPINILKKVVDKLAKIYSRAPQRVIVNGREKDDELLQFYVEHMNLNQHMNISDELFNLHKNTAIEPFVDKGLPKLRVHPADRYLFMSKDSVNPLRPTHFVKFMGERVRKEKTVSVFYVYTDDEFLPIDSNGEIVKEVLIENENLEGINPYGKIPATYINRSFHSLVPPVDTDTLKMTKLIPVILSDLNGAAMFQCFSILYGIDVKPEDLTMTPNAFWSLNSDPTKETRPEIGTIKPEVDVDKVINLIKAELIFWLHSKNITPGSVGTLEADNAASGISKIIDESDTVDARNKQVQFFKDAEKDMWDFIINHAHPYWRANGMIDTSLDFTPGIEVATNFPEQLPFSKRADLISQVKTELEIGTTTIERAVRTLNPEMNESEIEELLRELKEESTIVVPPQNNNEQDEEPIEDGSEAPEDLD